MQHFPYLHNSFPFSVSSIQTIYKQKDFTLNSCKFFFFFLLTEYQSFSVLIRCDTLILQLKLAECDLDSHLIDFDVYRRFVSIGQWLSEMNIPWKKRSCESDHLVKRISSFLFPCLPGRTASLARLSVLPVLRRGLCVQWLLGLSTVDGHTERWPLVSQLIWSRTNIPMTSNQGGPGD